MLGEGGAVGGAGGGLSELTRNPDASPSTIAMNTPAVTATRVATYASI